MMNRNSSTLADDDFVVDFDNLNNLEKSNFNKNSVYLDPYQSDLNLVISALDRLTAETLIQDGFSFMLASARATHGFVHGKIGFELKVLEVFDVSNSKLEETHTPEIRIGFSTLSLLNRLGETVDSFAYCNNAKKANGSQFVRYGAEFGRKNDILTALIDFDAKEISFLLNGQHQGVAFRFPERWNDASGTVPILIPQISVKNVKFCVNFSRQISDRSWPGLPMGFRYPNETELGARFPNPAPPAMKADSSVICTIGLPGSGKTSWIREFLRFETDQQWYILSTNTILDQMKVQGVHRKKVYRGRWDMIMGAVVKCLNRMILLACRQRRNFILDSTNCYWQARRKKMTPFVGFRRIAVVVVPTLEDYANRCQQQIMQEGKQMPSDAILEMKACFSLPKDDENDLFDEIRYVELQKEEAQRAVDFFNDEGKAFKPKERKRRGDWQQEELPADMLKRFRLISSCGSGPQSGGQGGGPAGQHLQAPHVPSSSMKPAVVSTPEDKRVNSKAHRFSTERPAWLSAGIPGAIPSASFTASTTTPTATMTSSTTVHLPSPAASPHPNRSSAGTPVPSFIPRSGWPANWPQAQPPRSTSSTPSSLSGTPSSQFVFPPP